jgi:hypothetical protein
MGVSHTGRTPGRFLAALTINPTTTGLGHYGRYSDFQALVCTAYCPALPRPLRPSDLAGGRS